MYDKNDLKDLARVEGCENDKGVWMKATGPGAARIAHAISGHGIGRWIEDRFSQESVEAFFKKHPEGKLAEFYMLVDDPSNPTISYVSLGAAQGDIFGVSKLPRLPVEGFAGDCIQKYGASRSMFPLMKLLADAEGLALDRCFTGERKVEKWTLSRDHHRVSDSVLTVYDDRGRHITYFENDVLLDFVASGEIKGIDDVESIRNVLVERGKINEDSEYFEYPRKPQPSIDDAGLTL